MRGKKIHLISLRKTRFLVPFLARVDIIDDNSDVSHKETLVVLLDTELDKGDLLSFVIQDKSNADMMAHLVPDYN